MLLIGLLWLDDTCVVTQRITRYDIQKSQQRGSIM